MMHSNEIFVYRKTVINPPNPNNWLLLLRNICCLVCQPWSWETLHSECLQIFAASCQEPLPLAAHSESLFMCISHLFSEPTQWSLDFLELVDSACRSDSKPPISPTTVAGAVTYLASASIIMPIRRLTLLKSLLFLHCIFPVRKSFFFCQRWVCIRWSWHSAMTKCFQVSMATISRHDVTT